MDLADVQHDSHHDVLERVVTADGPLADDVVVGKAHDVVARVLLVLLEQLVLVKQQTFAEGLVLVLLDNFVQLVVRELEQFAVCVAPDAHGHLVLHEDRPMIDRAALVKLLEDEGTALELRVNLHDAVFHEVERVRLLARVQDHVILVIRLLF